MGVFVFTMVIFCCLRCLRYIGCSGCLFQIVFGFSGLLKWFAVVLGMFSLFYVVFYCFCFVLGDVGDVFGLF